MGVATAWGRWFRKSRTPQPPCHNAQAVCTAPQWSPGGEFLFVGAVIPTLQVGQEDDLRRSSRRTPSDHQQIEKRTKRDGIPCIQVASLTTTAIFFV